MAFGRKKMLLVVTFFYFLFRKAAGDVPFLSSRHTPPPNHSESSSGLSPIQRKLVQLENKQKNYLIFRKIAPVILKTGYCS
jgi:hypothetical protein